jgi:peptidoglycan/LPS O-acetylase OafA/YrhL
VSEPSQKASSEDAATTGATSGVHLPALDGVRGLAILMVLLYHFVAQTTATNQFEATVNWVLGFGFLGVDLFFILSGFLITGILYDAQAGPDYFRNFYMRRVLRIFPLYYGVLAVVFFVVPAVPAFRGSEIASLREHQGWAWLYAVNVYLSIKGDWALSYIEHFWSLGVEEHFYFVWPFVVWFLAGKPRVLMRVALSVAVLALVARVWATHLGVSLVATTVLTPFQLDALLLGGFLAVWLRQPGGEAALKRAVAPMALGACALLLLQLGIHHLTESGLAVMRSLRYGAFHVLFASLLLQALAMPRTRFPASFFCSRPMVALGKYSYGLYVYHHFLSYYFAKHGTEFALARAVGSHTLAVALQAVGGIAASMAVAWVSYEFFEKYFLRLKRFWPSSRGPVAGRGRSTPASGTGAGHHVEASRARESSEPA